MQEIIGWIGAFPYIIAYFLVSKKSKADHLNFQLLNISGGVCLIVNSLHQSDYPSRFYEWRMSCNRCFCNLLQQKKVKLISSYR